MDIKKKLKQILFPHAFLIFLLFNASLVGLVMIFIHGMEQHFLAYPLYVMAFYTLVILCVRIPGTVKAVQQALHANKYTDRYLTDKDLRLHISMYRSLLINFVFAAFKLILGFVYNSAWFFAVAGYNMILSLMRFVLVGQSQKKGLTEYKARLRGLQSYRVCGWLMMVLNVAVSVIMFMVIVQKQTIQYHMIVTIGLAAFTFYCFTKAIINLIKYRERKNPIYAAVKRIDMVKAIVSIFTLQVAMLAVFQGQGEAINVDLMNTLTGVAVTIAINTIGALMIAGVRGDFRELENTEID